MIWFYYIVMSGFIYTYQQKKKDSLNETPDTTELSIPTVTEEADAIVAEVNSTPSDRTNTQ